MDNINILISINKKFLTYSEEMIFSLLHYSSKPINFYLMYQEQELDENDINNLNKFIVNTKKGKLIPIKFDTKHLLGLPVDDGMGNFFGLESYGRLFCAFLLPEEVQKILYVDVDMICTGDIKELYDISFDNKSWIACQDIGAQSQDFERLGLDGKTPYINSGMLLINIEKIRKNYTVSTIINLLKENQKSLIYPDQDFINKVFKGDIKIVDSKFNTLAKEKSYKELKEKPLIIHYAGSVKPWHDNVSRFEIEYIEPYYEALRIQGKNKESKLKEILNEHQKYGYKS